MYQDVEEGILAQAAAEAALETRRMVALRGRHRDVLIGDGALVKVNTSIGCSDRNLIGVELEKLAELAEVGYRPDVMMDLSIVRTARPLYSEIIERFGGPVGTLPHYLCYTPRGGIDRSCLLEEIERQAEAGVAWMTLHIAVNRSLWELARRTRATPVTARGGGMVVADMHQRSSGTGVFEEVLPEVLSILGRHNVALSLGTTFRPSNVGDALDEVHLAEIALQGDYMREAHRQGVQVLLEAVGHMTLTKTAEFTAIVRDKHDYQVPIMTLGPTPTDAAVGEDHVASAIGGAFLAMQGGTNVLNSVTREEHTGGVPAKASILEGLRAARIAAHAVNISLYDHDRADRAVADARADHHTCVVGGGLFGEANQSGYNMGCARCGRACPLRINFALEQAKRAGQAKRARQDSNLRPSVP